jgi:phosphoribosylanthranilate isomerase
MIIKICGITRKEDALAAVDAGADMLGFVFWKKSKRYVEPVRVRDIINELPPSVKKVGVFVDENEKAVWDLAEDLGLDALQFHGNETAPYCALFKDLFKVIKAFRVKDRESLIPIHNYQTDYYMLDTYTEAAPGGTGTAFDWKVIKDFEFLKPVILSGGLTPENVARAIREVSPFGVDVSSGVESSPGKKDAELIRRFITNARKA